MKLIFKDGDENKEITESLEMREHSIFSLQYKNAHNLFTSLIDENNGKSLRIANNIIAFCGDRGTGKSSCLKSFLEQIKDQRKDELIALDIIDPAFFDESHNIIELVLGHLYNAVILSRRKEDKCNETCDDETNGDEKFNDLLKSFDEAITNLKYLAKSADRQRFYDGLEELDALQAGISLQKSISTLFKKYIAYHNKKHLIISIDDIDLNIDGAYAMTECIRKYLINEDSIIFLGVSVEQLIDVVKNNIQKSHSISDKESHSMAVKYVTKFIPINRRVNMPSHEDYCDYELEYIPQAGNPILYHSVKEAVTHLIFWKTGYLFYNRETNSSLIIPRNLRSLRHLLKLLSSLEEHDKNNKEGHLYNQHIFKDYFFGTWLQQLEDEYLNVAKKIIANNNPLVLNKTVIAELCRLKQMKGLKQFEEITQIGNYAYNISLGDVMNILEYLQQDECDSQLKLLVFFILSVYSMRLYESYDKITENLNEMLCPVNKSVKNQELYAEDRLYEPINLLQKLVNGKYFSYSPNSILAPKGNERNVRDFHIIDGEKLREEIKLHLESNDWIDGQKEIKLRVLEYLMLCSSHVSQNQKDMKKIENDRANPTPSYLLSIAPTTKYLIFDVTKLFFNILNLEWAYNRFTSWLDKKSCTMFEYVKSRDYSLLSKMIDDHDIGTEKEEALHYLMSDAVIRNSEILMAMNSNFRMQRFQSRSKDNNRHLAEFYRSILNTKMYTYPQQKDGTPYEIRFNFLKPIIAALEKCEPEWFDSIFMNSKELKGNMDQLFSSKEYAGVTIRNKIRINFPDFYASIKNWSEIFPRESRFEKETIIKKIEDLYKDFKG